MDAVRSETRLTCMERPGPEIGKEAGRPYGSLTIPIRASDDA